jgi:glycine/D-amino acid oxidase-like deaminating enzyme
MWRLFKEQEQYHFHARLPGQAGIAPLVGTYFSATTVTQPVKAPLGGFVQHGTGYVRLPALLEFLAEWLQQQQALQHTAVSYEDLQIQPDRIVYGSHQAKNIIFCDGYRGMHNPWFKYLPFAPDKGEILTLQQLSNTREGQLPNKIINSTVWLLPIDEGKYRLGSTHNHHNQDNVPDEAGVTALMTGLKQLLLHPQQLELVRREAGVRPATSDRQPFLGTHPIHPRLHIFNGFGAHGSLTIPWYSQQMLYWLSDNKSLPATASILRYNADRQGTT